jgi:hypothetical protein
MLSRLRRLFRPRGRVLAVKWGYNPNSSSLGVDVTFLLFGMAAIALLTPLVALFLRGRRLPPASAADYSQTPSEPG